MYPADKTNLPQGPRVAVLLATYNGARFVDAQIRSLADNESAFTLHWIDDHSTDDTRAIVRDSARRAGIELREWHKPQHVGYPATFFELIARVDADIYLFSDQDDIWQQGKIDAMVADLRADVAAPVLSFSDPLVFYDDDPEVFYPMSQVHRIKPPESLRASRSFLSLPAAAQSMGITRALREIYLRHEEIARRYSYGHSWWLYLLAVATGEVRMLTDAPRTLWRQHGGNVTAPFFKRNQDILTKLASKWRVQELFRRGLSRQAQGFILAAETLPRSHKLDRLLALARLVAKIDRRVSPLGLARLLLSRAMWPSWGHKFWLGAACLCGDVKSPTATRPAHEVDETKVAVSEA